MDSLVSQSVFRERECPRLVLIELFLRWLNPAQGQSARAEKLHILLTALNRAQNPSRHERAGLELAFTAWGSERPLER